MQTAIRIHQGSATGLSMIADASIDLIVTSPPYPMIEMWDDTFGCQDSAIRDALTAGRGMDAFERMHRILDGAWAEAYRALKPGGMACINIGDATRTIRDVFSLYPNHARILTRLAELGFTILPDILWRKPTNAPNKFMGSGMLPTGAYVTYEHEYILIARKGARRVFTTPEEKQRRRESAFFWEERNLWFSDIWSDLTGVDQKIGAADAMRRSGAFPFELAYRLINMFSIKQDTVLDPFVGVGTTLKAAMASGRNGVGVECDPSFFEIACGLSNVNTDSINLYVSARLDRHRAFVEQRWKDGKPFKYVNGPYGFPVITQHETNLFMNKATDIAPLNQEIFNIKYSI